MRQLPSGCRGVMAATGVAPHVHAGEHVIWFMVPCQRPLTPCPPAEPCMHGTDNLLGRISHYPTHNCTRALRSKGTTGGAGGDSASHTFPDPVCAPLCTTGAHTVGGPCGRGQDAQSPQRRSAGAPGTLRPRSRGTRACQSRRYVRPVSRIDAIARPITLSGQYKARAITKPIPTRAGM